MTINYNLVSVVEKQISSKIKMLRVEKGMSGSALFKAADLSVNVGAYERGEHELRISTLIKIMMALDISPEEFFKDISWE